MFKLLKGVLFTVGVVLVLPSLAFFGILSHFCSKINALSAVKRPSLNDTKWLKNLNFPCH